MQLTSNSGVTFVTTELLDFNTIDGRELQYIQETHQLMDEVLLS